MNATLDICADPSDYPGQAGAWPIGLHAFVAIHNPGDQVLSLPFLPDRKLQIGPKKWASLALQSSLAPVGVTINGEAKRLCSTTKDYNLFCHTASVDSDQLLALPSVLNRFFNEVLYPNILVNCASFAVDLWNTLTSPKQHISLPLDNPTPAKLVEEIFALGSEPAPDFAWDSNWALIYAGPPDSTASDQESYRIYFEKMPFQDEKSVDGDAAPSFGREMLSGLTETEARQLFWLSREAALRMEPLTAAPPDRLYTAFLEDRMLHQQPLSRIFLFSEQCLVRLHLALADPAAEEGFPLYPQGSYSYTMQECEDWKLTGPVTQLSVDQIRSGPHAGRIARIWLKDAGGEHELHTDLWEEMRRAENLKTHTWKAEPERCLAGILAWTEAQAAPLDYDGTPDDTYINGIALVTRKS